MEDTESPFVKLGIVLLLILSVAAYSYPDFRNQIIDLFFWLSLFTGKLILGLSFVFLVSYIVVKFVQFYSDNLKNFIYKTDRLNSDLSKLIEEFQSFRTEVEKKLSDHLCRINDIDYELFNILEKKKSRQQLEYTSSARKSEMAFALEQLIPNSDLNVDSEEEC